MSFFQRKDRFQDLRKSPRHEVNYLAQIELGEDSPTLSCIICDISATGAKLTVGQREVPGEFTLVFRRRCRVVHQLDGQVGVQFIKAT
jgi:hypothetical protein